MVEVACSAAVAVAAAVLLLESSEPLCAQTNCTTPPLEKNFKGWHRTRTGTVEPKEPGVVYYDLAVLPAAVRAQAKDAFDLWNEALSQTEHPIRFKQVDHLASNAAAQAYDAEHFGITFAIGAVTLDGKRYPAAMDPKGFEDSGLAKAKITIDLNNTDFFDRFEINTYNTVIRKVVLHEVGHTLGLANTVPADRPCSQPVRGSVMNGLCGKNDRGDPSKNVPPAHPNSITVCDRNVVQTHQPPAPAPSPGGGDGGEEGSGGTGGTGGGSNPGGCYLATDCDGDGSPSWIDCDDSRAWIRPGWTDDEKCAIYEYIGDFGLDVNCDLENEYDDCVSVTARLLIPFEDPNDPAACGIIVAPSSFDVGPDAETRTVVVSMQDTQCSWDTFSAVPWLTATPNFTGNGGTVTLTIAENFSPSSRSGTAMVAGTTVLVNQAGAGCSFDVTPATALFGREAANGGITITAPSAECPWSVISDTPWLSVTGPASGYGNGGVTYSLSTNTTGVSRTATVAVAGRTVTITQEGNAVPVVHLTSPASEAVFSRPATILIEAAAHDPDGTITHVEFYADGALLGSVAAPPYRWTWTTSAGGPHIVSAKAYDDVGNGAMSPGVAVGIRTLDGVTVSPATLAAGALATITVTGAEPCGAVGIDYGDGSGEIVYPITTLPLALTHAWNSSGTKTVRARGHGNCIGESTSEVQVEPPGPPPVTLTAPANGAQFASPGPIQLTASVLETGGPVQYVEFLVGSVVLGSDTTTPYTFNWTNVGDGAYSLAARAVRTSGAVQTSDAVSVTVAPRVTGVIITPGAPLVGQPAVITVTGSASCGAVGIDYGDGTTIVHAITSLPFSVSHVWQITGTKTIRATGHGGCGGEEASAISVAANPAPSVSVTAPVNGAAYTAGASVTVAATASDPHGIQRVDFLVGGVVIASDTTAPYSTTWTIPSGTHTITARAVDTFGAVATSSAVTVAGRDVVSVSITPAAPTAGESATVTVNGSSSCGAVMIDFGEGSAITYPLTGLPFSTGHVWTTGGTRTVTAIGQGGCVGTASTTVSVNARPTVAITAPAYGNTYVGPASIALGAAAADADGAVTSVKFYVNSSLLLTDTSAPYGYQWSNVGNGTYTFTAVATDNLGTTTTSNPVSVTVNNPGPSTVTSIDIPSTVAAGQAVALTVYGTNPCGLVYIDFGDGNAWHHPIDQLPYATTHTWYTAGTYVITAVGHGGCVGQVTTTIVVVGAPEELADASSTVEHRLAPDSQSEPTPSERRRLTWFGSAASAVYAGNEGVRVHRATNGRAEWASG